MNNTRRSHGDHARYRLVLVMIPVELRSILWGMALIGCRDDIINRIWKDNVSVMQSIKEIIGGKEYDFLRADERLAGRLIFLTFDGRQQEDVSVKTRRGFLRGLREPAAQKAAKRPGP